MDKLQGAYSLVVMSPRKLIAARDPYGYRPLCIGKIGGSDVIASESCAILAAGGVNGDNAAAYAATGVDVLVTTWPYFGRPADIKVVMRAACGAE